GQGKRPSPSSLQLDNRKAALTVKRRRHWTDSHGVKEASFFLYFRGLGQNPRLLKSHIIKKAGVLRLVQHAPAFFKLNCAEKFIFLCFSAR
ncbi:MAG: hypothetical protein EA344_13235, partial [Alkalicoccus sp.]